jgi:excisionase family DNA binding protein
MPEMIGQPKQGSPVMTVNEVCAYLRVHRSTLYRLLKAGRIPYFRMGSDYRFNREQIKNWDERREV